MPVNGFESELRLLWTVGINAALLAPAWFYAGRVLHLRGAQRGVAVLLLWFCGQYLSVAAPGVMGVLSPLSMSLTAGLLGAAMALAAWRAAPPAAEAGDVGRRALAGGAAAVGGYALAVVWQMGLSPVLGDDALSYHIPAAMHWLERGAVEIYPLWNYNPANAWSPLGGSVLAVWWIAPMGGDVLARFMAVPGLLLLYFACAGLLRTMGLGGGSAAAFAVACAVARPFVGQIIVWKDDLLVTACFAALLCTLAHRWPMRWAGGAVAAGLMLAVKYTALLSLLPLVFLLPLRAMLGRDFWSRGRLIRGLGAAAIVMLLAGGWYLRNSVMTGNPLYPLRVQLGGVVLLEGLFATAAEPALRTAAGLWSVITDGFWAIDPMLLGVLGLGWLLAWRRVGELATSGVLRTALLGAPLLLAAWAVLSPYAELRFAHAALALMLLCGGAALAAWVQSERVRVLIAAVVSVCVGLGALELSSSAEAVVAATACAALVYAAYGLPRATAGYAAIGLGVVLVGVVYVEWRAYLSRRAIAADYHYATHYPDHAGAWRYLREHLRPDATVAVANSYLVLPVMNGQRRVVQVAPTKGLQRFVALPRLSDGALTGRQMIAAANAVWAADADYGDWLRRLRGSGASVLQVSLAPLYPEATSPIEQRWALDHPEQFRVIFQDRGAAIYWISGTDDPLAHTAARPTPVP